LFGSYFAKDKHKHDAVDRLICGIMLVSIIFFM